MNAPWSEAGQIKAELVGDGWRTPDTYDTHFNGEIDCSAVYLFLLFDIEKFFQTAFIAYVGMSSHLRHRWYGHNILPELEQPGVYAQRWFKPTPESDLRLVESQYIKRFDPPWNIAGRVRGVCLK